MADANFRQTGAGEDFIYAILSGITLSALTTYHVFLYVDGVQNDEYWLDQGTYHNILVKFINLKPDTSYKLKVQVWENGGYKSYEMECDGYIYEMKVTYTNITNPGTDKYYYPSTGDKKITLRAAPTKSGYVFYKWKFTANNNEFDAGTTVTLWCEGDYEFTAEWNEASTGSAKIYINSTAYPGWRNAVPYINVGTSTNPDWREATAYIYNGSGWKEGTT